MGSGPHLFLVAGEPSGDALGASLMQGLKQLAPGVRFSGVGGPLMEAEGLKSLFPMAELSVMGLAEVLPRLPALLRRVRETATEVVSLAPDALITIDSPDFCLRVAARARMQAPALKTIHYVAPTVWAWRPERAAKMARHIDHVLALFPFEPPYMQAEGMSCDFVGHPVVSTPQPEADEIAGFRHEIGLREGDRMLLVLPGSRAGEVARMGPVFGEVLGRLAAGRDDLRVVVPTTANMAETVKGLVRDWPFSPRLIDPRADSDAAKHKRLAFAAADAALAASGTVSLELAAAQTAVVIAYRFNWLTTRIIKKKVKLDSATLVNILTESRAVPEFLFEECCGDLIAPKVAALLDDPAQREAQLAASRRALAMLGKGGEAPGLRAARSVLRFVGRDDG